MYLLKLAAAKLKRILAGNNKRKQHHQRALMDVFVNEAKTAEIPTIKVTLCVTNPDEHENETDELSITAAKINKEQQENYNDNDYKKQAHELYNYGLQYSININHLVNNIDSYCKIPHGKTIIREHLAVILKNHDKALEKELEKRNSLIIEKQQKITEQQEKSALQQDELSAQQELLNEKQKQMNAKLKEHLELDANRKIQLNDAFLRVYNLKEQRKQAIQIANQGIDHFFWGIFTYAAGKVTQMIREVYKHPRSIIPKFLAFK